jgi:hypothetical protein
VLFADIKGSLHQGASPLAALAHGIYNSG